MTTGDPASVGKMLRVWRAEKGMTQADVAKAIGISSQQFQKYETGNSRIELSRLFEICRVFDKAPSDILSSVERPQAAQSPSIDISDIADSAELTSQADLSFQISELISSFMAIAKPADRHTAIYLVRCLSQK
ncbi:MAG: helix-turn-helix domain-containing protein [Rhizobiaceae bacterium]